MSDSLKFLAGAGGIFTALAGLVWAVASKTEPLMRDDVKKGFAAWLTNTELDRPFRDWSYSFAYLYDAVFGIRLLGDRLSFPLFRRVLIAMIVCLLVSSLLLGEAGPAFKTAAAFGSAHGDQYPEFVRSIFADLGLMFVLLFVTSTAAFYLSIVKTRMVLAAFARERRYRKRVVYVVADVLASLFMFAVVFQVSVALQQVSNSFVARHLSSVYIDFTYETPHDRQIAGQVSEIYLDFLLPIVTTLLLPIAWTVMFSIGGLVAKALMYIETLRRFAVRSFSLEEHPLLVMGWCLIAIWAIVFWLPVAAYALVAL